MGEFWILPGQFIPVSEDPGGIYFQGTSGLRVFAGNRGPQPVPGGLYVIKTNPDKIYRYFGNAADLADPVEVDSIPLKMNSVRQLKVARAAGKK